jgi:hypothetical protein
MPSKRKAVDIAGVPSQVPPPSALVEVLDALPVFQVLRFGLSKGEISKDTIKMPHLAQTINKFVAEHMTCPIDATNTDGKSFWQVQVHKVHDASSHNMQFSIASTPLQFCLLSKRAGREAKCSRALATQPPNGQAMAIRDDSPLWKFNALAKGTAWGTRTEVGETDGAEGGGGGG